MTETAAQDQASTPAYAPAICRVAVAQICLSSGYRQAEASALRCLTDIAIRYMELIAGSAASAANACGRTQPSIIDLALALEDAASCRGYAGAANAARPLVRSPVLRDLRAFVAAFDEIPFSRPLPRKLEAGPAWISTPSFAQAGKDPPFTHVPRWLPCFPDSAANSKVVETIKEMPAMEKTVAGRDMSRERDRVRFRLVQKGVGKTKKKAAAVEITRDWSADDGESDQEDGEGKRRRKVAAAAIASSCCCCQERDSNAGLLRAAEAGSVSMMR